MANKNKYASLNTLSTFLDNLKNLFATKTSVEELSDDVAYIDVENNENITDFETEATSITVDPALSTTSTNPVQNKVVTSKLNELSETIAGLDVSADLEYVTPQMFGAVGDNITDDTSAFQAAVDSGKMVVIPEGNYKVCGVEILHPVHIIGINYPRLTIPMVNELYIYQFLTVFRCRGGTLEGEPGGDGIIIEGIHFDGNWKAIAEANYESFGYPHPSYLANLKVHNAGIYIEQRSRNITIRDCKIDNCHDVGVGMVGCVKYITVENCLINEEGWHGYAWNKGIVATYTEFSGDADIEKISSYITLRNNRILNCASHGINLYTAHRDCIIDGNYIKDCGLMQTNPNPNEPIGTHGFGCCIKASGGANLIISNNICVNGLGNGIGLFGDTGNRGVEGTEDGNLGTVQVIGNRIIGKDCEESKASGIEVGGYLNAVISNNIIENIHIRAHSHSSGIRIQNGSIVSNNIIRNCDLGINVNSNAYDSENDIHEGLIQISDNMVMADIPMRVYYIEGGMISNNILITDKDENVIYLHESSNCLLSNNSINGGNLGIFIHLNSNNNLMNTNFFKNNKKNYYINEDNCFDNTIIHGSLSSASTTEF